MTTRDHVIHILFPFNVLKYKITQNRNKNDMNRHSKQNNATFLSLSLSHPKSYFEASTPSGGNFLANIYTEIWMRSLK